jgi:hypothetical protein
MPTANRCPEQGGQLACWSAGVGRSTCCRRKQELPDNDDDGDDDQDESRA